MQIVHTNEADDEVLKVYIDGDKLFLDGDQCDLAMTKTEALALAAMLMDLARECPKSTTIKSTRKRKDHNENN